MRTRLFSKPVFWGCVGAALLCVLAFALLRPPSRSGGDQLTASASSGPTPVDDAKLSPRYRTRSAAGDYMLVDAARMASLPTSGGPFNNMRKTAEQAMKMINLTRPSASSPWLPNYGGVAAEALAVALMYARTKDPRYRDFVVAANRFVIGSEDSASNNGTGGDDKLLATMRQISGYILAADLVGMDPDSTGSRDGYTSTVWRTWLASLRDKAIGTGNCSSIVDCNHKATNWGAWASAARIAIDTYLDDIGDLEVAAGRLALYLGETTTGAPWRKSSSYDKSWECVPPGLGVAFVPVNSSSCGADKDGVIVEDASRSDGSFPNWDDTGVDYTFHAYGAQLLAALMLERRGYDVWDWGDRALKRVMDRLDRLGVATGNGRSSASHVSWIARYVYGTSYPTTAAQPGNTLGYTDWLFGPAPLSFGRLTRNRREGTAVLVVSVPGAGRLVLSGRGLRKVTKTPQVPGKFRLRVMPTNRTRAQLRASGRRKVRVKVRFYPTADAAQADTKTFNLLRRR